MRSMTKEQAEFFIKAGYYPNSSDINAIVDLQDVFGHQGYYDVKRWLFNEETSENAERLYRLIWNSEDVDRMVKERDHIRALIAEKNELYKALGAINKELSRYDSIIG